MPLFRQPELPLLLPVFGFVWLAYVALTGAGHQLPFDAWLVPAAFTVLFLLLHFVLAAVLPDRDQLLLPLTAMLVAVGLVEVARLEPDLALTQLLWATLGVAVLAGVCIFMRSYLFLRDYKYLAAAAGIGLLGLTALVGREVNGARLWLGVGPYTFQTTEVMKVLLVLFLAGYLAEKRQLLARLTVNAGPVRLPNVSYLVPVGVIWAFTLLMLLWQRDLGSVLLLTGVTLLLLYVATGRASLVAGGAAMFAVNAFLAYHLFDHVRRRIEIWLDPFQDPRDAGFQTVQGLYAVAAGGISGTGLGRGFPEYIPYVHTDLVFAAISEELGAAGALAVVAVYLLLAFRGLRVALAERTDYGRLLALGFTGILALQTLVILAGNLSLMPLTGITLPFISYGGSSLLVNFLIVGMLLRLSAGPPRRRLRPGAAPPAPA